MRRSHSLAASRKSRPFPQLESLEGREVLSGLLQSFLPLLRPSLDATTSLVSTVNPVAGLASRPTQAPPSSNTASLSPVPFSSSTGAPGANGPIGLPALNVGLDVAASVLGIALNASLSAGASAKVLGGGSVGAAVNVAGPGPGVNLPQGEGGSGLINVGLQLSGGGGSLDVRIRAGGAVNGPGGPAAVPTTPVIVPELVGAPNGRAGAEQAIAAAPLATPAVPSGGTLADATPDAVGGPPTAGGGGDAASPLAPVALPPGLVSLQHSPADGDGTLLWEQFHPHGFGPFTDFFQLGRMATRAGRPLPQLTEPAWRSIEISLGLAAAAVALAMCEAVRRKTRRNQAAPSTHPEWGGPEPL